MMAALPALSVTYSNLGSVPAATSCFSCCTLASAICSSVTWAGWFWITTLQFVANPLPIVADSKAISLIIPCFAIALVCCLIAAYLGSLPKTLSAAWSKVWRVRSIAFQPEGSENAIPDVEISVPPATDEDADSVLGASPILSCDRMHPNEQSVSAKMRHDRSAFIVTVFSINLEFQRFKSYLGVGHYA